MLLVLLGLPLAGPMAAAEDWPDALRRMPLPADAPPLNRDNCIGVMLGAFQSNAVVKGLIFLPAVTDDFYLIHRDAPKLNLAARNLFEAVAALTNATAVRATFRAPFLLLHLDRDLRGPAFVIKDPRAAARLKEQHGLAQVVWVDRHWDSLQPLLRQQLKLRIMPQAGSQAAWHFYRHNVAGCGLSDWEVLTALSLAGRTTFTVSARQIEFEVKRAP